MNDIQHETLGRAEIEGIWGYLYNPGNIRWLDKNRWHGQVGQYKGFVIFSAPVWGCRALCRILSNYIFKEHLDTVAKIITRYAPPEENDTAAYIRNVCLWGAFRPHKQMQGVKAQIISLAKAITTQEQGYALYSGETWREAYDRQDIWGNLITKTLAKAKV